MYDKKTMFKILKISFKIAALFIIIILYSYQVNADYQWIQYNNNTGYNINSIKFKGNFGIMAGDNGIIKTTQNDGLSWSNQNSGCLDKLNAAHIENVDLIIIAGANKRILVSQDGGATWLNRTPNNISSQIEFYGVCAVNSEIWVAGSSSLILKSSDYGQTWTKQYEGVNNIKMIKMYPSGIGTAMGDNILLTTSDGGNNWSPVSISISNKFIAGYCLNEYLWFGVIDNGDNTFSLYQTYEGPGKWIFLYKFNFEVKSICFPNYYSGWTVGANGNIYYTPNNPSQWEKINIDTQISVNLNSAAFSNLNDTIWVAGNNGYYYKRFYNYSDSEPEFAGIYANAGGKYFVLTGDAIELTSERTIARNKQFLRYQWSSQDLTVSLENTDKIKSSFQSSEPGRYFVKLEIDDYGTSRSSDYAEVYVFDTYSQIYSQDAAVSGNNNGLILNGYAHNIDINLKDIPEYPDFKSVSAYIDLKNFRTVPHLFSAMKINPLYFNSVRPNISLFDDLSYTIVNFEMFDYATGNHINELSDAYDNLKIKYRLPPSISKFENRRFAVFNYDEGTEQWTRKSQIFLYNIMTGLEIEISLNHFSIYGLFALPDFEKQGEIEIFPNPFIGGDGNYKTGRYYTGADDGSGIYFSGINMKNAKIKIVNLAGYVVNELVNDNDSYFQWSVLDKKNKPVSSGLYYAIIESGSYKCVKKIQIIR